MSQVPAELELGEVLSEMSARDMHVGSTDRTFQDRPKTFDALNVMNAAYPFFASVVDRAVLVTEPRKLRIGFQFIRAHRRTFFHVRENVWLQCRTLNIFNDAGHHIALAFQHSKYNRLAGRAATTFATPALTADHGFVGFDMARKRRIAVNEAEILPKFVAHAPRRFVIHAKLTLQFLRGNTVARRCEQIHGVEPLLQWRVRIVERRADHWVNVITAALARIGWHLRKFVEFTDQAATRARKVCAVAHLEQVLQAGVIIGKHLHKLLDRYRLGHDRLRYGQSYSTGRYVCQLVNRQNELRAIGWGQAERAALANLTRLDAHSDDADRRPPGRQ